MWSFSSSPTLTLPLVSPSVKQITQTSFSFSFFFFYLFFSFYSCSSSSCSFSSCFCSSLHLFHSSTIAGGDYTQVTQLLTFGPSNPQQTVTIPIENDVITETMEQFFVSLSFAGNGNIQFNPMTAIIMIDDDDGKITVIINF